MREEVQQQFLGYVRRRVRETGKRPSEVVKDWAESMGMWRYDHRVRELANLMDVFLDDRTQKMRQKVHLGKKEPVERMKGWIRDE